MNGLNRRPASPGANALPRRMTLYVRTGPAAEAVKNTEWTRKEKTGFVLANSRGLAGSDLTGGAVSDSRLTFATQLWEPKNC